MPGFKQHRDRLASERALLKRLVLSYIDFAEARQLLYKLTGQDGEVAPDTEDRQSRLALRTAIIVAYARPFSGNTATPDTLSALPERYLRGLPKAHLAFHERMVALRNREFAHSDADRAGMTIRVSDHPELGKLAFPVSNVVRAPLSGPDLGMLEEILDHLVQSITVEQLRIQEILVPGEQF